MAATVLIGRRDALTSVYDHYDERPSVAG
jgi:hypothetical protein